MGGAPTVLNMIINAKETERGPLMGKVTVMTGGAPPPSQVLFCMQQLGFDLCHAYGSTETYGPGTVCAPKPEWDALPLETQAKLKSRQGLNHLGLEEVDVKDPVTMKSVAWDGKQSARSCSSGDLGVRHSDGYIEFKDRSKDIIISGGENISTIEVESVLFGHPAVFEAAVVGRPDERYGETPCAFVELKQG
ncbi:putative acid--thiol ligase [Helianthus annuus]|nr:putative acid--thiol ligase [Helianthus annuus]